MENLSPAEQNLWSMTPETSLYFCGRCHLAFRFPGLQAEVLESLYKGLSSERWQYQESHNVAWELARRTLGHLLEKQPYGKLLDIGAFDGAFLKNAEQRWEKFAVEPSAGGREELKNQGVAVIGDYLKAPANDWVEAFDAVTLFDVLEHLPHPQQSLKHAFDYVRPGGVLIVSTGNAAHWTWKLLKGEHWYSLPLQHICFATPEYFQGFARTVPGRIRELRFHPHQRESVTRRLLETVESIAFSGSRANGILRLLRRLLLSTPGLRYLRHREFAPHGAGLSDHVYVVLEKTA